MENRKPIDELLVEITRHPVNSSNIKSVGHSPKLNVLEVEFHSGAIWRYYPITEEAYKEMVNHPSINGYFMSQIRVNKMVKSEKVGHLNW